MKNFFKPTKVTWWVLSLFVFIILFIFVLVYVFHVQTNASNGIFWLFNGFRSFMFFPAFFIFHFTFYPMLGFLYGFNPDTDPDTLLAHALPFFIAQIFILILYSYLLASIASFLWNERYKK